jgi:glutathione synthase/RimK-type ligase-like ATP-grasp enzyme
MKNLYLILREDSNKTTFGLLKQSAEQRNIEIKPIYTEKFDFTDNIILTQDDGLFRIASDYKSSIVEKILINNEVVSFYDSYIDCITKMDNVVGASLMHSKLKLQIIPTIFTLPQNKDEIINYTQHLGGFPIILKAMGGMHGVGVIKIDSVDSLSSVLDYLNKRNENIILRKFIKHKEQARLIVLGDKVIASHGNLINEDFRTNVGNNSSRKRTVKEYNETINNMAVDAVKSLGYQFGGVDILFEEETNIPYIAEVNFPCFFPTTQRLTSIDISGQMIDFLINKSKIS